MNIKYTQEERQQILDRYLVYGEKITPILKETGVAKSTFYRWLNEYRKTKEFEKKKPINLQTYHQLEAKVVRLETIVKIIRETGVSSNSSLAVRLNMAEEISDKYNVHVLCDALDISRGTYYNHMLRNKRNNTWYAKRREELRVKVQEVFDDNKQRLGAEKITAVLRGQGVKTSTKMVRALMREMGIVSIGQGAKKFYEDNTTRQKNYLNQTFVTNAPNEVWVGDVTYYRYNENSYYICIVIDLFARMVVGYTIGKTNSTQLVKSAFMKAYALRHPTDALIFHSDRGMNYRSKHFNDYLKSVKVTHPFSRAYIPYDNSVVESFFASLKREELYRNRYPSEKALYNAINEYIVYYNTKRPHSRLQYKTPEQKEAEYALK